jgi:hypothetical protein
MARQSIPMDLIFFTAIQEQLGLRLMSSKGGSYRN